MRVAAARKQLARQAPAERSVKGDGMPGVGRRRRQRRRRGRQRGGKMEEIYVLRLGSGYLWGIDGLFPNAFTVCCSLAMAAWVYPKICMPPRCAAASITGAALPGLSLRPIASHDGSAPPRTAEASAAIPASPIWL